MTDLSASPLIAPPAPPAADRPPSGGVNAWARLEAAAALAAAVLGLLSYLTLPSSLPSEADYLSVSRAIRAQAREGDAVLLDPHWAERARLFIQGPPLLNLAGRPTREDLREYRRLFVLSLPSLPRSDPANTLKTLSELGFDPIGDPADHGALRLTLLQNRAPESPAFDFTGRISQAQVFIQRPDGSREICPLSHGRHRCPRAGWIDVGEEIKEIDRKPFRCLWAHPAGREPLVVAYADVPLTDTLEVMGGIVGQIAYRRGRYAPVELAVTIDGERAGELRFPPGEPGERRLRIDTRRWAGGHHAVQFQVTAENPDMRHFCFHAGAW